VAIKTPKNGSQELEARETGLFRGGGACKRISKIAPTFFHQLPNTGYDLAAQPVFILKLYFYPY
jgi:hypothetical protein